MSVAVPSSPLGAYWKLPEEERDGFRRRFRDLMFLPSNRTPTERQMILLMQTYNRSLRSPIFYGGAMGGAKTSGLCMLGIHLARTIPNNRVLMFRKEFSAFSASTLQELEEQLSVCPDAKHWPGKHEVHFDNGSEIWYMGVGTPKQREKLGSTQFGAALGDELTEVEQDTIRMLQTRLRWKPAAAVKRTVLAGAGNPYPGWIKQDFIAQPRRGYTFIPSFASDNPYLAPGYVEDMRSEMPDEWYRAFILGDWNAMMPTNSAIPFTLVAKARRRHEIANPTDCTWGIDCGHLGPDKTWIASRMGTQFRMVDGWGHTRIDETIDLIMLNLSQTAYLPNRIVVDYDGIGAGVADGLMRKQEDGELPDHIAIVGAHAQKAASIEPGHGFVKIRYANVKSQLAFQFRRLLEGNKGDLPDDEELEQDLTTANYDVIDGRIYIETKKLVRKKLGRSPDKGDAILLTMYDANTDEFAGLPNNSEQLLIDMEKSEDEELQDLLRQHDRQRFLRNPFRFIRGSGPNSDDSVGY